MSYFVKLSSRLREHQLNDSKLREASRVTVPPGENVLKRGHGSDANHGASNLDCILDYTTPSVNCHYPAKISIGESACKGRNLQNVSMPFYNWSNLWRYFDEWSAYGAGVPLQLPSGEAIVQYYVPYLSALQVYLHPGSVFFSNRRRSDADSDWSDVSDMRDVGSDVGSDNDNEKLLLRPRMKAENWESLSSHSSASSEEGDRQGELAFEYFERCSPYGRAPFAGKISELGTRFPCLLSLRSNEVSPASWFSVAWYPIYRIPMGPTMNDLSTCFLTFHSLWTPPWLQEDPSMEFGATSKHCMAEPQFVEHGIGYGCLSSVPADDCGCKQQGQAQWLRERSAWRVEPGAATLKLPAFGLAAYKLRGGPFWATATASGKQRAASLASSADAWLKRLGVQHPDYEFFTAREGRQIDNPGSRFECRPRRGVEDAV